MADPVPITLPPGSGPDVQFDGFTTDGEMLTTKIERQAMPNGDHEAVREALMVWDVDQQAAVTVVSRKAGAGKALRDQIYAPTGNARWIVWLQTDFTLDHADWTMWAYDRQSGDVRKLGTNDRGPDGRGAPYGWAEPIHILGDEAAWSAPVWGASGIVESRVYVADLRHGTVRRLPTYAFLPHVTATGEVTAQVAVSQDAQKHPFSRPGVIDLATGDVAFVPGFDPARVYDFAVGAAGMIEVRILKRPTADYPFTTADVLLQDASGTVREFPLQSGSGPVAVGDNVIVWQEGALMYQVWALASGQESGSGRQVRRDERF